MAQRRNRRKTRTVSDHALLAIQKYFLRAVHMQMQCTEARSRLHKKICAHFMKEQSPSVSLMPVSNKYRQTLRRFGEPDD
jgi:hypothetical protein